MQAANQNEPIIDKYFDMVQDKIKEILTKDKSLKDADVQKFNDLIFTQNDYEVRKDIQEYINNAANKSVDTEKIANALLDKFYTMVKTNDFNKDTVNDVQNNLQENKFVHLKKYNNFINKNI